VTLPKAEARPLEPKSGLVVTVDKTGRIHVEDATLSFAEFRASFKALASERGQQGIYLRADAGVPYGSVVQVLAVMRASGIADVGLVAEPEVLR
jgi:biopolymer transport protein TolR